MSNISKLTFKELAIPHFGEVFQLVDDVLKQHQVPYYLIGANAISLQLLRKGYTPLRGTKDIDFAIMVSSFAQYDAVKNDFVARGFHLARSPFTLHHVQYNTVIDLLPFGEIEEQDRVNFTEWVVNLVVLGFKETLSEADTIELEQAHTVQVPPLVGMIILKLIAWSDRPEMRDTDLDDIYQIISLYHDLSFEELIEHHTDLLEHEPYDTKLIAARMIGRKIGPIIGKSDKVQRRIHQIIDENIQATQKSKIAIQWAQKHQLTIDYACELLRELRTGMDEN